MEIQNTDRKLIPLKNKVLIKLENIPIRRTTSGVIYDVTFLKTDKRYGHIYLIHKEDEERYNLHIGDRVYFSIDNTSTISFKSVKDKVFIPFVLLVIHPEDIMAMASEEFTILDF